ncbi:MAG: hypothetical protein ACI8RZ_001423 [Myxococcota bacterium]|jgi:hypothetical protein
MTPLLLTAWSIAAAQGTPERSPPSSSDEPPLALPVDQVHAPVPGTPARQPAPDPERPLAIPRGSEPQRSAARLQALRQYQRERVSVGTEVEFRASGPPVSIGFGGPWYGMGWGMMVSNPSVYTSRTDTIYQGTTRMDMPDFLGTVDARNLRADLERDILRANRSTNVWNTVAGAGIAGIVIGGLGMSEARDAQTYYGYANFAIGGLVATIGGLAGSSFTSSKSFRLRRYPSSSIGTDEAERLADAYNDRLREGLGLTPDDVWGVESQGRVER